MKTISLLLAVCTAFLAGCYPRVSTEVLMEDRSSFNEVVVRSWDEQLLLNLVRLRYRDTPMFLELTSVITTRALSASASLGGEISLAPQQTGKASAETGLSVTHTPTISYVPLQGEEFAQRLLSPIKPSMILLLSQSGWSLQRLFAVCVQKANGLENAASASGPTPDTVPIYEEFQQLIEALRALQVERAFAIDLDEDGRTVLLQPLSVSARSDSNWAVVRRLLDLDESAPAYRVTAALMRESRDEIAVKTRSLLSMLFLLSQGVAVPEAHEKTGIVTTTLYPDGRRFEWQELLGRVFNVRWSAREPVRAAAKVFHRDNWFYVDDTDLTSKTTFNLLTYLFNLQAAGKGGREPLMTYPVR